MKDGLQKSQCAGPHQMVALDRMARGAEHQQHGDFGRGVGKHIRRVGDRNAARLQGRQIAVIDADGMVGDDLQARDRASRRSRLVKCSE
jgi:hypothetical protein